MAEKIDIVIQKNVTWHSSSDMQESMAQMQGEIESRQLREPGSEDSSREIGKWSTSILQQNEAEISQNFFPGKTIQRVPTMFRKIEANKECFGPLLVSLGPYHHHNSKFNDMQKLKVAMAKEFVERSKTPVEPLYSEVAEDASNYYIYMYEPEEIQFDNEFIDKMFVDGCFILQFMYLYVNERHRLNMTWHEANLVIRDLFLLENQIPFEVLKSLSKVKFNEEIEMPKLIKDFIGKVLALPPRRGTRRKKNISSEQKSMENIDNLSAIHLLEFLCLQFIGEEKEFDHFALQFIGEEKEFDHFAQGTNYSHRYRPATELKEVGITFEPSEDALRWDVKFKTTCLGGVLKLRPIIVDESTKSKLLNLVAYEYAYANQRGVSSYVQFMNSLIDNEEDVKELRSKGIIINFLGSDKEVVNLFNEMGMNLMPNPYDKVQKDIESYYKNVFKLWMIRHRYDIPTASAKYASLFGVMFTALKVVFPTEPTSIAYPVSTNFTRGP